MLFFSIFGQTRYESLAATFVFDEHYRGIIKAFQPAWTLVLFKIIFGVYIIVSNIVLVNLLIAMMTDTYQRIQVTLLTPTLELTLFTRGPNVSQFTPSFLVSFLVMLVLLFHTMQ
uniref:Ion transport domain-containing protein n=1 Tax=Cacopsylla melanoneura TaxID=428564 RepID=A0A8D8QIH2_9HEMI